MPTKDTRITLTCHHCGTKFTARYDHAVSQRFCSRVCANVSRRTERPTTMQLTCCHCGDTFTAPYRPDRPQRYCSDRCAGAARRVPAHDRFWARVDRTGDCWLWQGAKTPTGYGVFKHGDNQTAHRVAWELTHGAIPEGMNVLHRCDVRNCVNPSHLFLGTQAENVEDMMTKGRDRHPSGETHRTKTHPETIRRGEGSPHAKLTEADIPAIRAARAQGASLRIIAEQYGVSINTIHSIVLGKTWVHVP